MEYLIVKWLHVLSSTLLFGTGIGSAFYMLMACLHGDARIAYFIVRKVVIADWLFTVAAGADFSFGLASRLEALRRTAIAAARSARDHLRRR